MEYKNILNVEDIDMRLAEKHSEMFVTGYLRAMQEVINRFQGETGEILEAEVVQEIAEAGAEVAQDYMDTVTVHLEQ